MKPVRKYVRDNVWEGFGTTVPDIMDKKIQHQAIRYLTFSLWTQISDNLEGVIYRTLKGK